MVRKEVEDVSRSSIVHCRKEPRLELRGQYLMLVKTRL